ncbi:MAG: helix-turn-helix transcriptional regulator [Syntrophales bacterium]|nr:helix-turn-helix transcriptional regulator [Syntrophales bacterium]
MRKKPTQKQIAKRAGITNVWLNKILKGHHKRPISVVMVNRIVEASEGLYTPVDLLPGSVRELVRAGGND